MKAPLSIKIAAWLQWIGILLPFSLGVLLTYFPMGILVALTAKKTVNQFGESESVHSQKYIALGSSGFWEYWASPFKLLDWWNNLEDGTLGEPSGKHSARVKGKERSFWNQYLWLCRNPFNKFKRTSKLLACPVNECTIRFWGAEKLSDKVVGQQGEYWIEATHKVTGRKYYGYKMIELNDDGTVNATTYGFKIKPEHANEVQAPDDADKAFTFRKQIGAAID